MECLLNAAVVSAGFFVAAIAVGSKYLSENVGGDVVPTSTNTLLIAVGCVMTAVGIAGCLIDFVHRKLALRIYVGAAALLGLVLFGLAVYGLARGVQVIDETIQHRKAGLLRFQRAYNHSAKAKNSLDDLQALFRCCGVGGPSDWTGWFEYPETCCPSDEAKSAACPRSKIFKLGCVEGITRSLKYLYRLLYGLMVVFAAVCGATAGLTMYRSLKR